MVSYLLAYGYFIMSYLKLSNILPTSHDSASASTSVTTPQFRNVMYLTAWVTPEEYRPRLTESYLGRSNNVVPETSLLSTVTHVFLAFMHSDDFVVDPPPPQEWPLFENVTSVRSKFLPGTKVLVSIGGWGDTRNFSRAARSAESRKAFARNVAKMLKDTGADGVDIDWEYPGGNGPDYKEVPNSEKEWEIDAFPKLLADLRAEIGRGGILSAAIPGRPEDMMAFTKHTVPDMLEAVDFFNVMTYDLMNRRDNITKHHAGIKESTTSIDIYLGLGFPPDKMNLGFAFYVKWFNTKLDGCREDPIGCETVLMEDPKTGADLGQSGAFDWRQIPHQLRDPFQRALDHGSYDHQGGGQYYWDPEDRRWWTWESPLAIQRKFDSLVPTRCLGGVFAWALGEDSPQFDHLKALEESVSKHARGRAYGMNEQQL